MTATINASLALSGSILTGQDIAPVVPFALPPALAAVITGAVIALHTESSGTIDFTIPAQSCTGATSDIITATAHGYHDGDPVIFSGLTGGAGITAGVTYYVRDATVDTFKVAATAGGSAIDITTTMSAGTVSSKTLRRENVSISEPLKGANQTWAKIKGILVIVRKTDPTVASTGSVSIGTASAAVGSFETGPSLKEGDFIWINTAGYADPAFHLTVDFAALSAVNLTADVAVIGLPA